MIADASAGWSVLRDRTGYDGGMVPPYVFTCQDCGKTFERAVVRCGAPPRFCPPCVQGRERERNRETTRDARYRRAYGIGSVEVDALVASQNGACAICGSVPAKGLVVDHCHRRGDVRGMLCSGCNTFVGYLEARGRAGVEAAVAYLAKAGNVFQ